MTAKHHNPGDTTEICIGGYEAVGGPTASFYKHKTEQVGSINAENFLTF
jgi:hypothetical protein